MKYILWNISMVLYPFDRCRVGVLQKMKIIMGTQTREQVNKNG